MKNRQFIVLCILVIVGFMFLRFKIDVSKDQSSDTSITWKCYDRITWEEEKCP